MSGVRDWEWKNVDETLTPLDDLIRILNRAFKKLENAYTQTVVATSATGTFANGATSPNVSQAAVWKTNNVTAPTSIVSFTGAQAGKTFDLIAGDANTTIVHDATKIITKTGLIRVLALNDVTRFITFDGIIFRECPRP